MAAAGMVCLAWTQTVWQMLSLNTTWGKQWLTELSEQKGSWKQHVLAAKTLSLWVNALVSGHQGPECHRGDLPLLMERIQQKQLSV